jgi:hypothetical protein
MRIPLRSIYPIPILSSISMRSFFKNNLDLFYYINNDYINQVTSDNYFFLQNLQIQMNNMSVIHTNNIPLEENDSLYVEIDKNSPMVHDIQQLVNEMTKDLFLIKKDNELSNTNKIIDEIFNYHINEFIIKEPTSLLFNDINNETYESMSYISVELLYKFKPDISF